MKTCYLCKGPIQTARVEHMAHRAGVYTLIRDLPVERCSQCGEVYLDELASRMIDAALSSESATGDSIEVPVVHCQ